MTHDWRRTSAILKEKLCLGSDPVGVTLSDEELAAGIHAQDTTVCHMLLRSRHDRERGILRSKAIDMRCVWGSSALGLMASPLRLSEGMLYLGFVADQEAGKSLHARMGMIGDDGRKYSWLLTYPLDLAPQEPQAVVIYLTPGRALRAIIAHLHLKGGAIETPMTGQASVCASISRAVRDEKASLDIPCIGDRAMGLVGDDEMVFVLPSASLDSFLTGLERTEYVAPYPYHPFTGWSPVLPPMFTPLPEDME
jgi:uncharacterized protein (DUF169 family)